MRDGRPSLIADIRLFVGAYRNDRYLHNDELVAYARRLAWLLNAQGLSLGAWHLHYILLTTDLPLGQISLGGPEYHWWHRYASYGVAPVELDDANVRTTVRRATVQTLSRIVPEAQDLILSTEPLAMEPSTRFVYITKTHKAFTIRQATTIAVRPTESDIHLSLADHATGRDYEMLAVKGGVCLMNLTAGLVAGLKELDPRREPDGQLSVVVPPHLRTDKSHLGRRFLAPVTERWTKLIRVPH